MAPATDSFAYESRKVEVKFAPEQAMKAHTAKKKYSSTLSLTWAIDGDGWLTPRPGRFTPGKETLHLLYRRLGRPCPRGSLEGCGKSRPHRNYKSRIRDKQEMDREFKSIHFSENRHLER